MSMDELQAMLGAVPQFPPWYGSHGQKHAGVRVRAEVLRSGGVDLCPRHMPPYN